MEALHNVEIRTNASGTDAEILLDGVSLKGITAFSLEAEAGEGAHLTITLIPENVCLGTTRADVRAKDALTKEAAEKLAGLPVSDTSIIDPLVDAVICEINARTKENDARPFVP